MSEKVALYFLLVVGLGIITDWVLDEPVENFTSELETPMENKELFFEKPMDTNGMYIQKPHNVDWDNVNERQKHLLPKTEKYTIKDGDDAFIFDASKFSLDVSPFESDEFTPLTLT